MTFCGESKLIRNAQSQIWPAVKKTVVQTGNKMFRFGVSSRDFANRDEVATSIGRNPNWFPHQIGEEKRWTNPKAIICMSEKGNDPMEVAVTWQILVWNGFRISFATEGGKTPKCDEKLTKGWLRKMIGSTKEAVEMHEHLSDLNEYTNPINWSEEGFTLLDYHLVIVPGGFDKDIVPFLESKKLQDLLAELRPHLKREAKADRKVLAAIGQGVVPVAKSRCPDGTGLLDHIITTAYPPWMEKADYMSTYLSSGRYCRTYYEYIGTEVKNNLKEARKYLDGPHERTPYIIVDPEYFYVSARYSGDTEKFAKALVKQVQVANGSLRRRAQEWNTFGQVQADGKLGKPT